jgi:hypothetical protein
MNDPQSAPAKPASTGFHGKTAKKNTLHQKKRKRSSAGRTEDSAPVPQNDPPRPTIRVTLEAQGAKRKLTTSKLQLEHPLPFVTNSIVTFATPQDRKQ